jgi:predicted nucleic acid-binding protein
MGMASSRKLKCYLDACVLIDLIEHPIDQEPAKTIAAMLADAEDGRISLVTSTITIPEVTWAKTELDNKAIDSEVQKKIDRLWNPASSSIALVEVHELIAREALALLRGGIERGWCKTKALDGIHLATAKRENVDELITTEHAMKKWADLLGFKVCSPHREGDGQWDLI